MIKAKYILGMMGLLIFFFLAAPAWSEEWIFYNASKEGKMYFDKSSIEDLGHNIVNVKTKTILNEKGKTEAFSFIKKKNINLCSRGQINYELTIEQYDCAKGQYKNISTSIYDKKNEVILGQKAIVGKWSDIRDKSIVEKIKKIVCSAVQKK